MKKIFLISLLSLCSFCTFAQNTAEAKKVLDKTAAIVGRQGGAQAKFTVSSSNMDSQAGTIAIKGSMFQAKTPKAIVWYNGKTQWSYLRQTNEVNISTPTEAKRMSMNPYTFISMYKNGYDLSLTKKGNNYVVHMTAQNKKRSVQEVYITINKKTSIPSQVKMKQGNTWTNINISNFRAVNQPNSNFTFNPKDFPQAEVIDLR